MPAWPIITQAKAAEQTIVKCWWLVSADAVETRYSQLPSQFNLALDDTALPRKEPYGVLSAQTLNSFPLGSMK